MYQFWSPTKVLINFKQSTKHTFHLIILEKVDDTSAPTSIFYMYIVSPIPFYNFTTIKVWKGFISKIIAQLCGVQFSPLILVLLWYHDMYIGPQKIPWFLWEFKFYAVFHNLKKKFIYKILTEKHQ